MATETRVGLALAIAITVALYAPVLQGPFVYEDEQWIATLDAPIEWSIPSRDLTRWTWQVTETQPLDPAVGHKVNVLLHLVNGGLVYGVASVLAGPVVGLGAAVVMLWHPLNTQAASYLSARTDVLMTLWVLAAMWFALVAWRWWQWVGMLACLLCAAMSKEIGAVGVLLVAWTLLVLRPDIWRRYASFLAPLWIACGIAIGMTWTRLYGWLTLAPHAGGGEWTPQGYALAQLSALTNLLSLVIWPVGLSIDHDVIALDPRWTLVGSLLVWQAVVVTIAWWRRAPIVAWALGWIALSVAPRFVFQTNEFLTESQLYLGMAGIAVLVGYGLAWAWRPQRSQEGVFA